LRLLLAGFGGNVCCRYRPAVRRVTGEASGSAPRDVGHNAHTSMFAALRERCPESSDFRLVRKSVGSIGVCVIAQKRAMSGDE
jgi:hypothetical protein